MTKRNRSREKDGAVEAEGPVGGQQLLAEILEDPEFREHFEDARVRSTLLVELINARRVIDMTQAMVADAMETTQSAVSELEGGATDPRLSTLQRYARAVGAQLHCSLVRPQGMATTYIVIQSPMQQSFEAIGPPAFKKPSESAFSGIWNYSQHQEVGAR